MSSKSTQGAKAAPKPQRRTDKFLRELPLYIMLVPAVVLVAIYSYGGMVGTVIAFQKFNPANGLFGSEWVGLKNFQNLFSMPNFWPVIRNTIVISLAKMIGNIVVPVTFSLLLNEVSRSGLKRTYQTMVYLPNFLSWIILSGIFVDILSPSSGIVGRAFQAFGAKAPFFLGDSFWFPITMVVTDVWKNFGFKSVIYLAALTGVDPALYESASIDGANRWKQTWHITLPGILSTIVLMTVLSMADILNGGFDQIYNLYSPAVYSTGDILDTFVYRLGIERTQFALSTAAGLFKSGVSLIFVTASYWMADRFAGYRIF
ncbi:ABC transporter permease [Acutalibacter intestini]|uniref:ABC transporter permease n=1 Tax=Acutalibacter intestini TaxID=3093659 RepID=UPI00346115CD